MRDLARRLLAAAHSPGSGATAPDETPQDAARVFEMLKASLSQFAGGEGFAALMRRAVALSSAEFPAVKNMNLSPDCTPNGLETLDAEASIVLTAHLLALMVTFIGEPLTLRLLRQAWPGILLDEQGTVEEKSRHTS